MPYLGAESDIDPVLGLGSYMVDNHAGCLPNGDGSQYHIAMDNFFTGILLLKYLKAKNIFANRTI